MTSLHTVIARSPHVDTIRGLLAMLAAAGLWGLVVVGPDLVPDASATAIVGGRFATLGLVALAMSGGSLRGRDWGRALRYALAGFVGYYLLLVVGIQMVGATPAAVVLGLTPVIYAVVGARHERLDVRTLIVPLSIVTLGVVLVHAIDLGSLGARSVGEFAIGMALVLASVGVWMWYAISNGRYLRRSSIDSRTWTATVGMAAGLLSAPMLGHAVATGGIGSDVGRWLVVVLVLGVGSAWLGTMAWNTASRLLPESVIGPLMVVELLVALGYAHLVTGHAPSAITLAGYGMLVAGGLISAVRVQRMRAHVRT